MQPRIIIDLDHTICIPNLEFEDIHRRYVMAKPIVKMIENMQKLDKKGFYIIIHTARGMKSCNGNASLAHQKNFLVAEKWLKDNDVPFYVALPSSTFDWDKRDGLKEIPIEERGSEEVKYIQGLDGEQIRKVLLTPPDSPAVNYGFDITPSRLVTGLITERGICKASEDSILGLFPDK